MTIILTQAGVCRHISKHNSASNSYREQHILASDSYSEQHILARNSYGEQHILAINSSIHRSACARDLFLCVRGDGPFCLEIARVALRALHPVCYSHGSQRADDHGSARGSVHGHCHGNGACGLTDQTQHILWSDSWAGATYAIHAC